MSNQKLVLIGPVAPFRGGIAHFLTSFSVHMSELCETHIISFKRLYPKFLYPGKFQKELNTKKIKNTDYIVDTLNPFTWIKVLKKIFSLKPNIVVFTYWTSYLFIFYYFLIFFIKKKNIKIAIDFHNLGDHEAKILGVFLSKCLIKKSDFVFYQEINLNKSDLLKINSNAKFKYMLKPCKQDFDLNINQFKRKASLELLFYGFIRPYKGLDILLNAMSLVKNKIDVHLTVVGEIWYKSEEYWKSIINNYKLNKVVSFDPNYVNDVDTVKYFKRADFVVMPYKSVTGSAIFSLAQYFDKKIIASNIGNFSNIIESNGLLFEKNDSKDLSDKIILADLLNKKSKNIIKNNIKKKNNFKNYTEDFKNFLFN